MLKGGLAAAQCRRQTTESISCTLKALQTSDVCHCIWELAQVVARNSQPLEIGQG